MRHLYHNMKVSYNLLVVDDTHADTEDHVQDTEND